MLERYNETTVITEKHIFDAAVHIRNQFGHFESNAEREDSTAALSAAYSYMNSTKYGNLLRNIGAKLRKEISR